jgi:8-oxo-dGTP pyrophosphatase MutT (NUDIX family)
MRIVGCFLEFEDKFVILLRHTHKPDGNTWGLPSGKVEQGEKDTGAILRELEEETGYKATHSELEHLGDFDFISSRDRPYTFATFRVRLQNVHNIKLEESAHADYKWVTAKECYAKSDLISDFHELLRLIGYIR